MTLCSLYYIYYIIYLKQKKRKKIFIVGSDMVKTNRKSAKKIDEKGTEANTTSQNSEFVAKQGS